MRSLRLLLCAVVLLASSAFGADVPKRPPITGFSHVSFYATSVEADSQFNEKTLGLRPGNRPGLSLVGKQSVEYEPRKNNSDPSLLSHIAFATPDVDAMRKFLAANKIEVPAKVNVEKNGIKWFALKDPEGVPIEFVQETVKPDNNPNAISSQIIHAGFVVHDRAKEDKFYRDLLGFKLYWHGGMEPENTDWVAMQVPDGRQWIEYMLVRDGQKLSPETLGVLNHYSLGVKDIHDAEKFLAARGWTPNDRSKVQMGKDGKWQLNVYDPDGTRVEMMEFTPKEKPCCAEFTAEHPKP